MRFVSRVVVVSGGGLVGVANEMATKVIRLIRYWLRIPHRCRGHCVDNNEEWRCLIRGLFSTDECGNSQ